MKIFKFLFMGKLSFICYMTSKHKWIKSNIISVALPVLDLHQKYTSHICWRCGKER